MNRIGVQVPIKGKIIYKNGVDTHHRYEKVDQNEWIPIWNLLDRTSRNQEKYFPCVMSSH